MANAPKATVEITAKNSTTAGLREASKSVNEFGEKVKASLEAAFAIVGAASLGEFFKASIEQSMEAQRNFTDLSVALRNVGASAQTAMPQIEKLVEQLGDSTGIKIDDINAAMVRLVTSTGDYHKAMTALPTVLDVAKARHMDLEQASTLVGKAFNGNETALKKLGIVVHDGQTPFDALRAAYKGFADEEGKNFEGQLGRIKNSWDEVLQAVGDAITGSDSMSGASEGLAGALKDVEAYISKNHQAIADMTSVVIKLATWMGDILAGVLQLVIEGFKGVEEVAIMVTAGFEEIPAAGKLAFGSLLSVIGSFLESANGVLDKLGIHIGDGMAARVKQAGVDMVKGASDAIDTIHAQMIDAMGDIENPHASKRKPITNLPKLRPDSSEGTPGKSKDDADKKFREDVAGYTALLALDDQRAAALQHLNELAAKELTIIHSSSALAQDRVKAAERYGMIMKAIQGDEAKRYSDAFNNDKAQLDFDDTHAEGVKALNILAAQELAISQDTTQSIHDREEAMARYKSIVDAITSDDQKRFTDQLRVDSSLLGLANQRQNALAKLTKEAEAQKKIAIDTTKPDQERVIAAQRLNQILSATGGKIHLAMTGTESFKEVTQSLRDMADETINLNNVMGELGGETLASLTDGLGGMFEAIGSGKGVFESLSEAVKKSVSDTAKHEGQLEIGRGMAALATGTWPPNPVALAAAGKHFAAGAFLEALGGALGGGGGSGGGGGAGNTSQSMNQTQNAMNANKPTGQIVIKGGLLNLNDPAQADQLANAIQTVYGLRMVITGNNTSTKAMY